MARVSPRPLKGRLSRIAAANPNTSARSVVLNEKTTLVTAAPQLCSPWNLKAKLSKTDR